MAGIIGEVEGKRWLTQQGYEVYSFALLEHYFDLLKSTMDGMIRKRKQEYIVLYPRPSTNSAKSLDMWST
jgi:hypothetical protein